MAKNAGRERAVRAREERASIRERFGLKLSVSGRRLRREAHAADIDARHAIPWTVFDVFTTALQVLGGLAALAFFGVAWWLLVRGTWLSALAGVLTFLASVGLVWLLDSRPTPRSIAVQDLSAALLKSRMKLAEAQMLEYARFYSTSEWRQLRRRTIRRDGAVCSICGVRPRGGDLTVDHILPRSSRPDLALTPSNLQVLCRSCNSSKGAR